MGRFEAGAGPWVVQGHDARLGRWGVITLAELQDPDRGTLPEQDRGTRVLLVEDAPFLRYAFGRLLRLHGFEVCEAIDGREAIERLREFRPQLILTDLMMPVMDGVALIRHLHGDPSTAALPIVAITADATPQTIRDAREAGAIDVITKPIDLPSLLGHLRDLKLI